MLRTWPSGQIQRRHSLRVTDRISEDRGALVRSVRAAQLEKQVVAVEEVVPEHKGRRSPARNASPIKNA